jgi:histidinol-phosphate aminotransferase
MSGPSPRKVFKDISSYSLPALETMAEKRTHRMSFNELPFGASPAAIAAYHKASECISRYPEERSVSLIMALKTHYELKAEKIFISAGSDSILNDIAAAYIEHGDEIIISEHSYCLYKEATERWNGVSILVPETAELKIDIDGIIAAISEKTKIIYVTNPANPMGTIISPAQIRRLHSMIPSHILLVIDAAYAEFIEQDNDYDDFFSLTDCSSDNVVILRSFSKIYGLAGLRIGWAYGSPSVVKVLEYLNDGYTVTVVAQETAIAALKDQDFTERMRAYNDKWQNTFYRELTKLGIEITPSRANFFMMHFSDIETAEKVAEYLSGHGIYINKLMAYSLPKSLRVTISTPVANEHFLELMKQR